MRGIRFVTAGLIWLVWLAAAGATALGVMAPWFAELEMVNHFRPFILLAAAALVIAALPLGSRPLFASAGLQVGRELGSDHRPVVVDIALATK